MSSSLLNELIDEVNADEINLSSFTPKEELNPSIWNGEKLKKGIREKLIDIFDAYWKDNGYNDDPEDILLIGSSCNYNWYENSDLDLHIIVDFSKLDKNKEFVEKYYKSTSREWNNAHENLNINGVPVEIYVQDIDSDIDSEGVYSLMDNKWLKKPDKSKINDADIDAGKIKATVADIETIIDNMETVYNHTDNYPELYDDVNKLIDNLINLRKKGLSRKGEMDEANIIYKSIKRNGYLEKLWDLSDKVFDKVFSYAVDN